MQQSNDKKSTGNVDGLELKNRILDAKERGCPDYKIAKIFNVSFERLRKIYDSAFGKTLKISKRPKKINAYHPKDFSLENGTVWSFKSRGSWATHDGKYRGNWSPYVPRNLILRYTEPGDTVLDCFVGGGTTAVEAKLLGRRCIARDINPGAVGITRENLNFSILAGGEENEHLPIYEPDVSVGDARDLKDIPDNSIDFVCTHPPYAGIIKYSSGIEGDLSAFNIDEFSFEMAKVVKEIIRVLKPRGRCAILIGDTRQRKHVIPIGFRTIKLFTNLGFSLEELLIKRQHNCKTTGFWYQRSIKYNFFLLAHEYLPVFSNTGIPNASKLVPSSIPSKKTAKGVIRKCAIAKDSDNYETSTVWLMEGNTARQDIIRNLNRRFVPNKSGLTEIVLQNNKTEFNFKNLESEPMLLIHPSQNLRDMHMCSSYIASVKCISQLFEHSKTSDKYLAIECNDVRTESALIPTSILVYEELSKIRNLILREIIVLANKMPTQVQDGDEAFKSAHKYLLIYRVLKSPR